MKSPLAFTLAALVTLSLSARAEVLYTVHEQTDTLYTIDTATLALTPVGPLNAPYQFGDLAFDASTGTMYMTTGWGTTPSELYRVDLATGNATLVGSMGFDSIFGLVYDPAANRLYGSVSTDSPTDFYEINRVTGAATYVGTLANYIDGMTYVGSTSSIVGIHAGPGNVYSIDPATAAVTLIGGSGFVDNCGVAWGPATNQVYSIDWSGNLFAFDVASGYTRVTLASGLGSHDGLALAGPVCVQPVAYCAAGTSSSGCAPSIVASGTPSAPATSGFSISASNVEGARSSIFFYGMAGTLAAPWAAGSTSFLCVKAPTQRSTPQSSGGTLGVCDGAVSIDWLAFMASRPNALGQPLSAGQTFHGQFWVHDPPSPKSSSLTNALEWTLCP